MDAASATRLPIHAKPPSGIMSISIQTRKKVPKKASAAIALRIAANLGAARAYSNPLTISSIV
jgi:hypothetical protein